jgi:hypothetical protein
MRSRFSTLTLGSRATLSSPRSTMLSKPYRTNSSSCVEATLSVLAAQSIGEPATQMTLNKSHYIGVPRLNSRSFTWRNVWYLGCPVYRRTGDADDTQYIPAFLDSTVDRSPGEMWGTLAAQSIGERGTWMTRNTIMSAFLGSTGRRCKIYCCGHTSRMGQPKPMWTGKQILSRHSIFTRQDPSSPHYLPVNLNRIGQNAKQIFHIDAVKTLSDKLIVVRGGDPLSFGCPVYWRTGDADDTQHITLCRHSSTQPDAGAKYIVADTQVGWDSQNQCGPANRYFHGTVSSHVKTQVLLITFP